MQRLCRKVEARAFTEDYSGEFSGDNVVPEIECPVTQAAEMFAAACGAWELLRVLERNREEA